MTRVSCYSLWPPYSPAHLLGGSNYVIGIEGHLFLTFIDEVIKVSFTHLLFEIFMEGLVVTSVIPTAGVVPIIGAIWWLALG